MTALRWSLRVLAVTLWFGLMTNWSWTWRTMDALHAFVALVLGTVLLFHQRRRKIRIAPWSSLACTMGGLLACAGPLLMLLPPLTLAAIFDTAEIQTERTIEKVHSPGRAWTAVVRYRQVGAYSSAQGRILVTARPSWLPCVEQDLTGPVRTERSESQGPFVRWVGADLLRLEEYQQVVAVSWARVHLPWSFLPLRIIAGWVWTACANRLDLHGTDESVSSDCAKWEVWGVRPGMTIASIGRMDPDLSYRSWHLGPEHVWEVAFWDRRDKEGLQWRFGYEGKAVTESALRSSRVVALRLSAGAIALGHDGAVRELGIVRRLRERWGPPTRSLTLQGEDPVAESWSPPAQHADVWSDPVCHSVARLTWGDGPQANNGSASGGLYRYTLIEIFDTRARVRGVEDAFAGKAWLGF